MDETRAQAYLQLIQTLLTCPNGEKQQILQANSELLDSGFLQICEVIAQKCTEEGQENPAHFLRNFASQICDFWGINEEGHSDNFDVNNSQKYSNFIRQLLQAEQDSQSDIAVIYPMLARRQYLLNMRFPEILQQVAHNLIAEENLEKIDSIIAVIENLSIHISKFPLGNTANNIEIAIAGYQIVLSNWECGSQKWARTQSNLATAYWKRIRGDEAENIEKAIECYTSALEIYTRDTFPKNWATMQNNLGIAYYKRVKGDGAENIEKAIDSYNAALAVYSGDAFRQDWAGTQNNLATAYLYRIRGD